ncbi:uncharacterized protein F5Z01DRAFT_651090 [Emericellopsis atlantica]|uniref:Rhodopsin family protein n=1 Tax=Emericellopsis atlantica TaxID=2614577 RepID=A0A9P8CQX3_9HYPO|nr:uncharacterized protein F5Z01DRAFT_651090 [Emericellopsis atlantica]KAG9256108.1 hypothetical protein F5Z01DRAFT_651090 [Emericellopsis atlantica]
MFFFFVCGEKTIRSKLPGYEGVVCQCHNCGNMSGRVLKRRPFFTFCFVPIIPFSISGYKDISCHICNYNQPLEQRPDVQAMANGGAGAGPQRGPDPRSQQGHFNPQQQQYQGQGPPPGPQGWGKQGPPPPQGGHHYG